MYDVCASVEETIPWETCGSLSEHHYTWDSETKDINYYLMWVPNQAISKVLSTKLASSR